MRMLRHYDKIDLLKPERIDNETGYRFYSATQLPRLNRIIALRMMGLSLEEISRMLQDDLSANEVRALFEAKQATLEKQIREEQARLTLLVSRLKQIEVEGLLRQDVALKKVEAQWVLSLRETVADFSGMDILMTHAKLLLDEHKQLGPGIALFYDDMFECEQVDWEFGLVAQNEQVEMLELADKRQLRLQRLPALKQVASLMYEGPYQGLHLGYSALGHWIECNGFCITGFGREVFWHMKFEMPESNVTELQFPVERAA